MEIKTTKFVSHVDFSIPEMVIKVFKREEDYVVDEELNVKIISTREYSDRYLEGEDFSGEDEKVQSLIKSFWEIYKDA